MAPLQPRLFDGDDSTSEFVCRLQYHGEENRFTLVFGLQEESRHTAASGRLTVAPAGDYGHLPGAIAREVERWLYDADWWPQGAVRRTIGLVRYGLTPL